MDIRKLQKLVVDALEDVKGQDIEVLNTTKLTSLFDRIVIATGTSNRQVKALARSVFDKVREAGVEVNGIEGEDGGEWVLVDLGDIVVHVMQPAVRSYYNLEELWMSKPAAAKRAKVADGDAEPAPKKAPAKRATKAAAGKEAAAPVKKAPAKRTKAVADGAAPAPAKKPAAKRTPRAKSSEE